MTSLLVTRSNLILIAILLSLPMASLAQSVSTKKGVFLGAITETRHGRVEEYLGIPFAMPPTGARRFLSPRALPDAVGQTHVASRQPLPCLQKSLLGEVVGSEDCLYLNIWRPASRMKNMPVMVFIHGGANAFGGIADEITKGDLLALHGNVLVVSIQYRLGIFGFLADDRISNESGDISVGNFAVLDQIAALNWVRDHIAAFGGDPGNITIFGESAGATAVNVLRSSPLAGPLFRRAISQSSPRGIHTREEAIKLGRADVDRLCQSRRYRSILNCLQNVPVEKLLEVNRAPVHVDSRSIVDMGFRAVVDGYVVTDAEGHGISKPYLVGTNLLEAEAFVPLALNFNETEAALRNLLGDHFDRLVPRSYISRYRDAVRGLATDVAYGCLAERLAHQSVESGAATYRYHYRHSALTVFGFSIPPYHATELPMVFGGLSPMLNTKDNRVVSHFMKSAWTNFAHTGDPNRGPNRLAALWPRDEAQSKYLVIGGSGSHFVQKAGSISPACQYVD